jgi:hypothetical protein
MMRAYANVCVRNHKRAKAFNASAMQYAILCSCFQLGCHVTKRGALLVKAPSSLTKSGDQATATIRTRLFTRKRAYPGLISERPHGRSLQHSDKASSCPLLFVRRVTCSGKDQRRNKLKDLRSLAYNKVILSLRNFLRVPANIAVSHFRNSIADLHQSQPQ